MNRFMSQIALLCLLSTAACSSSNALDTNMQSPNSAHFSDPTIAIGASSEDSILSFQFQDCATRRPAAVSKIRVFERVGDTEISSCFLRLHPSIHAEWIYGTVPAGGQGPCSPLERGKTYFMDVVGSGMGGQSFRLAEDGSLQLLEGDCAYHSPSASQ